MNKELLANFGLLPHQVYKSLTSSFPLPTGSETPPSFVIFWVLAWWPASPFCFVQCCWGAKWLFLILLWSSRWLLHIVYLRGERGWPLRSAGLQIRVKTFWSLPHPTGSCVAVNMPDSTAAKGTWCLKDTSEIRASLATVQTPGQCPHKEFWGLSQDPAPLCSRNLS